MSGPKANEVEVSLFGPGFGECSVVHIGDGRWIIIDSCIDARTGEPAALSYLQDIGVSLDAVELIVATHWHDDHVRGLARIVRECSRARLCIPAILTIPELTASILAHDDRPMSRVTSGVAEMRQVLEQCQGTHVIRGTADRRIIMIPGTEFSHCQDVEVWTLSPCDASTQRFLKSLNRLLPVQGVQKQRVPSISPNECSVVVWISVGPVGLLLGADLEEDGAAGGWSAILASSGRPNRLATFFKVPHHGSANAHHPDIWRRLISPDPLYALAPYDRGRKLPTRADVQRLKSHAARGYSTSQVASRPKRIKGTVGKIIKEFNIKIESFEASMGHVRGRTIDFVNGRFAAVELFKGARPIDDLY